MSGTRGFGLAKWFIAAFFVVLCSSEALALKYVIPYPNDKRDAMVFVVHAKKDGSFEFRVILDEKKLGQRVVGFLVEAHPEREMGQGLRGVEFSAALPRDKDGKLHVTFVLDRELAYIARGELAVAAFPGDGKDVPGGTFLAFKFSGIVDFGPDAISESDLQRRIEKLSATGRFQDTKDSRPSVKELFQRRCVRFPRKIECRTRQSTGAAEPALLVMKAKTIFSLPTVLKT